MKKKHIKKIYKRISLFYIMSDICTEYVYNLNNEFNIKIEYISILSSIVKMNNNINYNSNNKRFIIDIVINNIDVLNNNKHYFESKNIISNNNNITNQELEYNIKLINESYNLMYIIISIQNIINYYISNNLNLDIKNINKEIKYIKDNLINYNFFFIDEFVEKIYKELNDQIIYYYNVMNDRQYYKINDINVINVVRHCDAVKYVFKYIDGNEIPTILSMDTHPDNNGINLQEISKENILSNITNIGQVHAPIIAGYTKNNGIIWATPTWINKENAEFNTYESNYNNNKRLLLDNTKELNNNYYKLCLSKENINKCKKKVKFCIGLIENIIEYESYITNDYILNIDLDYFCCYGSDENDNDNEINDIASYNCDKISENRTILDFNYAIKNRKYRSKKEKEINNEINCIRNRIKLFLKTLIYLKDKGKNPKLIIFCDSTQSNVKFEFASDDNCNMDNGYTPQYLVFWIKQCLINNFNLIYK
jgi:hypothetical protein